MTPSTHFTEGRARKAMRVRIHCGLRTFIPLEIFGGRYDHDTVVLVEFYI